MRAGRVLALAAIVIGVTAPSAHGAFHLMKVSEVFPGTNANVNTAFIELQMFEAGQNLVAGHKVDYYTASGSLLGSYTIAANVPNGESQRKILIGDEQVAGATPDFVVPMLGEALHPGTTGGGAVCFPDAQPPDCVSWGGFTPPAGFPNVQTANAPVIPDGSSLTRSTAPACPNLLEPADDTDSSATDFAVGTPTPENNSSPLPTGCGAVGDDEPPETTIDKVKVKGDDVKVKFSANESATFKCKLDKGKYKNCTAPKKYKNLDSGKHKIKVKATDDAGNTDNSAAKEKFEV